MRLIAGACTLALLTVPVGAQTVRLRDVVARPQAPMLSMAVLAGSSNFASGRPTLVRTPEGRDQASRVVALVDMQTGEVLYTVLTWERVEGLIAVYYGHAPGIPVPVPIRMAERYVTRSGALVAGEATYANFRQFETSARIIP